MSGPWVYSFEFLCVSFLGQSLFLTDIFSTGSILAHPGFEHGNHGPAVDMFYKLLFSAASWRNFREQGSPRYVYCL